MEKASTGLLAFFKPALFQEQASTINEQVTYNPPGPSA